MMNKLRSAKLHLIKFLFIVPLLAVILLAFRQQVNHQQSNEAPAVNRAILIPNISNDVLVPDTVPVKPQPPAKPHPPTIVRPNNKGYIITVADNYGECIVIIRDRQNKILKAISLEEWNENEKVLTGQYGSIPPPPPARTPLAPAAPDAPHAPVLPDNVESIHIKDKLVTIGLKNGVVEKYDLAKPEELMQFERKYQSVHGSPQNPGSKPGEKNPTQKDNSLFPTLIIDSKQEASAPKVPTVIHSRFRPTAITNVDTVSKVQLHLPVDFDGIILVDGKEYTVKSFEEEVYIEPSQINAVEVLKDDSAVKSYGEKGKKGVIRIETKRNKLKAD